MNDCCRYDFEQNKKNNLIFHGIIADHPETPEGWVLTAEMEISYQNLLNPTLMSDHEEKKTFLTILTKG